MEKVEPTSDIFIHYLFGKEENSDILLSFVNAVLEDSDMPLVKEVQIQNPFNIQNYRTDKLTILDIKAKDEKGRIYDIEVQVAGNELYATRSLYYWAKTYAAQLDEGEHYKRLRPVICINLLNFVLLKETDQPHNCFIPTEMKNPDLRLTKHFEIHFMELPKFSKNSSLGETLHRWFGYFIYESTGEENMKYALSDDPIIQKAHKEYEKFNASSELREIYEARRKWQLDHNTAVYVAHEEGVAEGIERGIEQGIERGLERGMLTKAQEIARSLIGKLDDQEVAEATGLSLQEVKALKKQ